MMKIALFYPALSPCRVPAIFQNLTEMYSKAVSKLFEREVTKLGIRVRQSPISKYIVSEGLLSIASIVRAYGHHVEYFEEQFLIDNFDYETEINRIANEFDIVAISVATPAFPHVVQLIAKIKKINPRILIMVGGPHVTYLDQEVLDNGADFVVRGEGEEAATQLINLLARDTDWHNVPGISYKYKGRVIRNDEGLLDMSVIPTPAYDLVPKEMRSHASVSIMTSRGCMAKCGFCAEGHYFKGLRFENPDQTIRKIHAYLDVFPFNYVMIYDSTFTSPKTRMLNLVDILGSEFPDVYFGCNARADNIDDETIKHLQDSRFITLFLGGESGSDIILRLANKNITTNNLQQGLLLIGDRIPFTLVTFIIGHAGETLASAHATIEFIEQLYQRTNVFQVNTRLLIPYPGTPFFSHPEKYGLIIIDRNYSEYTRYNYPPVIATDHLSKYEIWYLFLESYLLCTTELARRAQMMDLLCQVLQDIDMKEMSYSKTKPSIPNLVD